MGLLLLGLSALFFAGFALTENFAPCECNGIGKVQRLTGRFIVAHADGGDCVALFAVNVRAANADSDKKAVNIGGAHGLNLAL